MFYRSPRLGNNPNDAFIFILRSFLLSPATSRHKLGACDYFLVASGSLVLTDSGAILKPAPLSYPNRPHVLQKTFRSKPSSRFSF